MTPGLYIDWINSGENPRDMINDWYNNQPESTRFICGRESVQENYIRVERLDFGRGPEGYDIYMRFPDLEHIDTAYWKPQTYILKFLTNGKLAIDADRTWPDAVRQREVARTVRVATENAKRERAKALREKTALESMDDFFKAGGKGQEQQPEEDDESDAEKKEEEIPFAV